jgi:hypothetical protein
VEGRIKGLLSSECDGPRHNSLMRRKSEDKCWWCIYAVGAMQCDADDVVCACGQEIVVYGVSVWMTEREREE